MQRLTEPLLKTGQQFKPVTLAEAWRVIAQRNLLVEANRSLVMATGDYSNEELYLIQRLARTGLCTNAIGSFEYYQKGTAFFIDKNDIVPYAELLGSGHFYTILDPAAKSVSLDTVSAILEMRKETPRYDFNTPGHLNIHNFGAFFRSINQYILRNGLEKGIYVNGLGKNYESYKKALLAEDSQALLEVNHLTDKDIRDFADPLLRAEAPVFIIWERLLDERGIIELENLCMLLDIQAKPSSGFLCLKAELNSQGLYDMGMFPGICVGGEPFDDANKKRMQEIYGQSIFTDPVDLPKRIENRDFAQCFIFNATGTETPAEIIEAVKASTFSVLQTAYWTDTCDYFDLVLPASLPEESDGTYTDSTRAAHNSKADTPCPLPCNNLQLFSLWSEQFGLGKLDTASDVFLEYISFFQGGCRSDLRHFFR